MNRRAIGAPRPVPHVLFCIALDPGSAARRILNDLAVDPARVKRELDKCIAPAPKRRAGRRGKATQGACSFCGSGSSALSGRRPTTLTWAL